MKKQIFTIVLMLMTYSAFSQTEKTRNYQSTPYPNTIITDEFTVLDINFDNNLVAFKHVFQLRTNYDENGEIYQKPYNCNYKGMNQMPFSGVVLGVYDLAKQEYLKTFTIYNASYKKSDCYSYEKSKNNLNEAKIFFKKNNLDISKKPKPEDLIIMNLPENSFILKGIYFKCTNEHVVSDDGADMTTVSKLYTYENEGNEKLIYTINQQDNFYMGSGGKINYISAYVKDNKFILLNKFYHTSGMAGETDRETYHFSPVFDILKLKN